MRIVILSLLLSSTVFAQTVEERKKIIASSNKTQIEYLNQFNKDYFKQQQLLINEYIEKNRLNPSEAFSLQRFVESEPVFYTTDNAESVATLRANTMYPGGSLGLSVTGSGMTAAVWDGGKVRDTHLEFSNRITLGDASTALSSHGTHVTGTIIAQGLVNLNRRGFAYQANARTHDWTSDVFEMTAFAGEGYLVSNHSYGNIASSLPQYSFGSYSSQSRELDILMNTYPYYQVVKSAGNDRNDFSITQVVANNGYDLLTGWATAKNVLTIGAVDDVANYNNPLDVVMSSFSNYGPPDDGRIKPDLVANGVSVFSCNSTSNTAFFELSGTSMASPAITGLIVLLQKHFNNLNTSLYMKSATVRGVLCHTAREAGDANGPDYRFGWGLADGFIASKLISGKGTTSVLEEKTLLTGSTYTASFTINTVQDVNATISWTDPVGASNGTALDNRTPRLINNLDLKIYKDGTIYYPWKLDPTNPTAAATNNSDNNVDNIERVQILNAQPGTYTIEVSHKGNLLDGAQDYTLIASSSATSGIVLNNADFIADNNLFVFPNPADNFISFSNPNDYKVSSITISDIAGKQVAYYNDNAVTNTIDVSNLQSGVYFIKFNTEGQTTIKKFIKN